MKSSAKFLVFVWCFFISALEFKSQDITTIAGNGTAGYGGDNGTALSAAINSPWGLAVDKKNNIYVADRGNNRIRKITPGGIITTFAGTGVAGYGGDGGLATSAMLNYCTGVAVDKIGNVFIADANNYRIRKVDTAGIISTVAGTGTSGFNGDGGLATSAQIGGCNAVGLDSIGNLYLSDRPNYRIRKVDTAGIITTIGGTGIAGYSGDGGPALNAQMNNTNEIEADAGGNVYFHDQDPGATYARVRKIDINGIITTVAGTGSVGFSGDGGPATSAEIIGAAGIALDRLGNIYIAGGDYNRIRKIDVNGIITTVAGNGTQGFSGDGGPALSAELFLPLGVAVDTTGNLYIADTWNNRIRKVDNSVSVKYMPGKSFGLELFPNPTDGTIYITGFDLRMTNFYLEITDITGKVIAKKEVESLNGVARLDCDLPDGMYMLIIHNSGGVVTKKLMIKR